MAKRGKLNARLFPDSGHHFYFFPFAIGQGQGTDAATRYARENELPTLDVTASTNLSSLCNRGDDWITAREGDREIIWLRGKFGTKIETHASQPLLVLGLWCAIETNTGTGDDGYTIDSDGPLLTLADENNDAKGSTPYRASDPSEINFQKAQTFNLNELFGIQKAVGASLGEPILEISWEADRSQFVSVSLIIDFGNTRTIAVGLERRAANYQSTLRELIRPILFTRGHDNAARAQRPPTTEELIPNSWMILREPTFAGKKFVPPAFSWPNMVTQSVRRGFFKRSHETDSKVVRKVPHMFAEVSPAVLGLEATDLLVSADVTGGHLSFLSSPKRYSWDDQPVGKQGLSVWYMHPRTGVGTMLPLAGELFRFLPRQSDLRRELVVTDEPVAPTEWQDESIKPVSAPSRPDFARGDALIWSAVALLERASKQIQSESWRSGSPVRRVLDHVVVTFPPGWTNEELHAYWRAWYLAKLIFNWAHGGRPVEISLDMQLDEAVASQLTFVFSEIQKFNSRVERWVSACGKLHGTHPSVRVLTIDIGGGTTDTALVEYSSGPSKTETHLVLKVLFSDTTTRAGDKLIKELIEAVLLPTLGERFASDETRRSEFENFFSASRRLNDSDDRLGRMVLTRSVFVPMVYKWLEDLSNNRDGNPATGSKWEPTDAGANPVQIDKLNGMLREAGLAESDLLQRGQPFDVSYDKVRELIQSWCVPLAELHAKYVEIFDADLVVVTGKPSELPIVQKNLIATLPLHEKRILFAKNYDAGDWFPGALGGKVPDAKMVTVVGASLYTAIKEKLLPGWRLEEKVEQQPRNYWGIIREAGGSFDLEAVFLAPDQDEVDVVLPIGCVIARARFLQNEPEPVYVLMPRARFDDQPQRSASQEAKIRIRRVSTDPDGRILKNESLILLPSAPPRTSPYLSIEHVELKLRTLAFDEVHWLDQGHFSVRWGNL